MMKIYINRQNGRNQYRVRAIENNIDIAAYYADSKNEASRVKRFLEKVLSSDKSEENTEVISLYNRSDKEEIMIAYSPADIAPEVLSEMVKEQVYDKYGYVFGNPKEIKPTVDDKKIEIIFNQNTIDKKVIVIDLNGLGYADEISSILTDDNCEV